MLAASKEKGFEDIKEWIRGVRKHLYWCVTSTLEGSGNLIEAKWKSFMRHVANKHSDHPDELYKECAHEELEPRLWIRMGTPVWDKLNRLLTNKAIIGDVRKLSPDTQTSCLGGFHSTLNHWHPKMICFSWLGTVCRHVLASLHFNENVQRQTHTNKDGQECVKVTWPKYKLGEEVVRKLAVALTYGYVQEMKHLLFSIPEADLKKVYNKYLEKVPDALNSQFPDKVSKKVAVERYQMRKLMETELYPVAEEQRSLFSEDLPSATTPQQTNPTVTRKKPSCKTCGEPMRGHKKGQQ